MRGENGIDSQLSSGEREGGFEECTEGDAGAGHEKVQG